jgi:predicted metal-dependent HD superfamily phosphohydrolase
MLKETFLQACLHYTPDTIRSEKLWVEIEKSYSKRSRYYHNLQHLEALLGYLNALQCEIQHWNTIIFALVYHDIIYHPLQTDNEDKSAALARERLTELKTPPDIIEKVSNIILKTKGHSKSQDGDTNIFLDADLSILGADPEIYRNYCDQIRREYKLIPDFLYKQGRKRILQNILKMPAVYKTSFFADLEQKARFNLQEELKILE